MIEDLLSRTFVEFIKILPVLLFAILLSQIIKQYLNKKHLHSIKENKKHLFDATILGIALPGPIMSYFPILKELRLKGIQPSIIASFMTSQALFGPMRLILEVAYFGVLFLFYHLIVIFSVGMMIGLLFIMIERKANFLR